MSDAHTHQVLPPVPSAGYRLFQEMQRREAGDIRHTALPGLLPDGYRLVGTSSVGHRYGHDL